VCAHTHTSPPENAHGCWPAGCNTTRKRRGEKEKYHAGGGGGCCKWSRGKAEAAAARRRSLASLDNHMVIEVRPRVVACVYGPPMEGAARKVEEDEGKRVALAHCLRLTATPSARWWWWPGEGNGLLLVHRVQDN
jgi:hypothetical protein